MTTTRKMYQLAIPTIIENILQITLSSVDTYFVASIGTVAISAVGLNTLISNLYLSLFIALGTAVSIMTARSDGEKNHERTKHLIIEGLVLNLLVNLLVLIINILFGKSLLILLSKDIALTDTAYIYFRSVILPIVTLSTMTMLSSILKSLNDTKTPMYTVFIINILNVGLDYCLIFGVGQFKGLGILGAGLATTISRFVGCIILIIKLQQKTHFIQSFKVKYSSTIKQMIHYAIPVCLEKLSMRIGQLVYGSLIIAIGIEHYAAHNIAGTIEAYSYLPALGFGVASFTMIGHAIGEKNYDKIRTIGHMTYRSATIMMIGIGIVFFIFAPQLTSLFTQDPVVHKLVVSVLRLIALFQPMLASTQVLASTLQSLGDVKFPFYLTTFGIWGIRIVGTYVLGNRLGFGLVGVWTAYVIDITIRGVLLYIRFCNKTATPEILKEVYEHA